MLYVQGSVKGKLEFPPGGTLVFAILLWILLLGVWGASAGETQGGGLSSLLPQGIIDAYFPQGKAYPLPRDPRISGVLRRAETYETEGRFRQAAHAYSLAYNRLRNTEDAPYVLFKQFTLMEDLDASIRRLSELLEVYPSFPLIDAASFELARRLYVKKDAGSAILTLERIVKSEEQKPAIFTPYARSFLGVLNFNLGEYRAAVDQYERSLDALAPDPDGGAVVRNYIGISRALVELENFGPTGELLKKVIGSSSSELYRQESLFLLGQLFQREGREDLAAAAYTELLERFPESLAALRVRTEVKWIRLSDESLPALDLSGTYDELLLQGRYRVGEQGLYLVGERTSSLEEVPQKGYSIQVGSFSQAENAGRLASDLKKKGLSAYAVKAETGEKGLYRVRVGPVATMREAGELKRTIEALGYSGFILQEK